MSMLGSEVGKRTLGPGCHFFSLQWLLLPLTVAWGVYPWPTPSKGGRGRAPAFSTSPHGGAGEQPQPKPHIHGLHQMAAGGRLVPSGINYFESSSAGNNKKWENMDVEPGWWYWHKNSMGVNTKKEEELLKIKRTMLVQEQFGLNWKLDCHFSHQVTEALIQPSNWSCGENKKSPVNRYIHL